ncbi:hypothetical protein BDR04DRAFT_1114238 [Suillus decipiens]|nr:hypothetical protein BDR04DRAFT_1114238 [Suillus decipiens]
MIAPEHSLPAQGHMFNIPTDLPDDPIVHASPDHTFCLWDIGGGVPCDAYISVSDLSKHMRMHGVRGPGYLPIHANAMLMDTPSAEIVVLLDSSQVLRSLETPVFLQYDQLPYRLNEKPPNQILLQVEDQRRNPTPKTNLMLIASNLPKDQNQGTS